MTSRLAEVKKILEERDHRKWNPDYEVLYRHIYKLYRRKKWRCLYETMMWVLAMEEAYESGELDEEDERRQEEIEEWRDRQSEERRWH